MQAIGWAVWFKGPNICNLIEVPLAYLLISADSSVHLQLCDRCPQKLLRHTRTYVLHIRKCHAGMRAGHSQPGHGQTSPPACWLDPERPPSVSASASCSAQGYCTHPHTDGPCMSHHNGYNDRACKRPAEKCKPIGLSRSHVLLCHWCATYVHTHIWHS